MGRDRSPTRLQPAQRQRSLRTQLEEQEEAPRSRLIARWPRSPGTRTSPAMGGISRCYLTGWAA